MAKLKIKKINASTLVETIVALVIILAFTAITVSIFVQVTNTGQSATMIKAESLISQYSNEVNVRKTFFDEEFSHDDFLIRKEVVNEEYPSALVQVKFSVYNGNGQLVRHRNFIFLRDEKN